MDSIEAPNPRLARQVWNFARHFFEMCIAMCVGGSILMAAAFGIATQLGRPALREEAPGLAVLATAVIYTLPMVAWMLFRGMDGRATAEMAAATLAVGVVLVGLAALGVMTTNDLSTWASAAFCGPACVVMLPVMLLRRDMYSGRAGHHHVAHVVQPA
jgi:hypothetical protein